MGVIPSDWATPIVTPWNREWFTTGTLAVQVCAKCGFIQHPPEEVCHECGGDEFEYRVLEPRGSVHSFIIAHYPANPALSESVPYAVVLVSLDEAPEVRVTGNLPNVPLDGLKIGMRVACYWEERAGADGVTVRLPQWRPA
jgi:uncharacterized protein